MMLESRRVAILALAVIGVGELGCARPPIAWDGPAARGASPFPSGVTLVPRTPGQPARVVTPVAREAPHRERRQCTATLRYTNGPGGVVYAAWWTARPDSSAILRTARSADGGQHWEKPLTADERDQSVRGCSRPAPAIAVDRDSGYLHMAYYLESADGAGVFYKHLMQGMFHAPVVIVYGERPVAVAIGAAGDTVVVAYEDPNRRTPQIMLALSRTTGHVFDTRVPASGDDVDARAPVVGVGGGRLAVGWYQTGRRGDDEDGTDAAANAGAVPVLREGTL